MLNREDNEKTEDEEAEEEKKSHCNVLCPHYLLFAQKLTNYLQECIISFIPTLVGLGQVHNINTLHVESINYEGWNSISEMTAFNLPYNRVTKCQFF